MEHGCDPLRAGEPTEKVFHNEDYRLHVEGLDLSNCCLRGVKLQNIIDPVNEYEDVFSAREQPELITDVNFHIETSDTLPYWELSRRRYSIPKFQYWEWITLHQVASDTIKVALADARVMHTSVKKLTIQAHASKTSIGVVLLQLGDEGTLRSMKNTSRRTTPANRNYTTRESEYLPLIWALKRRHDQLQGQKFTLETNVGAMTQLRVQTGFTERLARCKWSLHMFDSDLVRRYSIEGETTESLSRTFEENDSFLPIEIMAERLRHFERDSMVFFLSYGEPDSPTDLREFDPVAFFVASYALVLTYRAVDLANFGAHSYEWYSVTGVLGYVFPQTSDDLQSFPDLVAQFFKPIPMYTSPMMDTLVSNSQATSYPIWLIGDLIDLDSSIPPSPSVSPAPVFNKKFCSVGVDHEQPGHNPPVDLQILTEKHGFTTGAEFQIDTGDSKPIKRRACIALSNSASPLKSELVDAWFTRDLGNNPLRTGISAADEYPVRESHLQIPGLDLSNCCLQGEKQHRFIDLLSEYTARAPKRDHEITASSENVSCQKNGDMRTNDQTHIENQYIVMERPPYNVPDFESEHRETTVFDPSRIQVATPRQSPPLRHTPTASKNTRILTEFGTTTKSLSEVNVSWYPELPYICVDESAPDTDFGTMYPYSIEGLEPEKLKESSRVLTRAIKFLVTHGRLYWFWFDMSGHSHRTSSYYLLAMPQKFHEQVIPTHHQNNVTDGEYDIERVETEVWLDDHISTIPSVLWHLVYDRWELSRKVLVDPQPHLTSTIPRAIYQILGMSKKNPRSCYPLTGNSFGNTNCKLHTALRNMAKTNTKEWDYLLPSVTIDSRWYVQRRTRDSPYFIVMGQDHPVLLLDLLRKPMAQLEDRRARRLREFFLKVHEFIIVVRQDTHIPTEHGVPRVHDKGRSETFAFGDLVNIATRTRSIFTPRIFTSKILYRVVGLTPRPTIIYMASRKHGERRTVPGNRLTPCYFHSRELGFVPGPFVC